MRLIDTQTVNSPRREAGLTLIELMIAMLIAAIILSGVLAVFITSLQSSRNALLVARMEQDLNAVLLVMAEDIRRAGYWGTEAEDIDDLTANPFWTASTALSIENAGSPSGDTCIRYTYNYNDDNPAVVDDNERFGFRLNNQVIEMYDDPASSGDWTCGSTGSVWYPLTDSSFMSVTNASLVLDKVSVASTSFATIYTSLVSVDLIGELELSSGETVNKDVSVTIMLGNSSAE